MAELAGPAIGPGAAAGKRRWPLSPARTVVALSTGLIVIIFAVFGLLCWQGYWTTLNSAKARAQTAADIVATEAEWIVSSSLAVLNQVAQQVAADQTQLASLADSARLAALSPLPANVSLAVYDSTGKLLTEGGEARLPQSVAESLYFQKLAAGEDWAISRQIQDRASGRPIFAIGKRLVSNGAFVGVAALSIDAALLEELWRPLQLGPESTISLVRDDGWIVARYPALPQAIDLSGLPVFKTLSASATGSYDSPSSPADGVARVVAFHHVPDIHLLALASISQDSVLSGLWTAIVTVLWLMGPIAIALFVGALVTAQILRRSERTQANLAAAVAHNEVLFREIHHRVKNNLQSVASLLQMQPIPREIKTNMGQRIAAMSAVHEHIYRSNSFADVRVKDYLQTLIENIRAGQDPNVAVLEQFEDLRVDKDAAAPLGLILNEVVSNAFKHAFDGSRQGVVKVDLSRTDDGRGRLVVADNGTGFDPQAPSKGIGRRLISALTQQINGESHFGPAEGGGSRFELTFPLAPDPQRA